MAITEKVLFASDLHIPYHHPRYLDLLMKVQKSFKPDTIAYLGDIDDACPVSRWSEGKADELEKALITYAPQVQTFFKDSREISPDARIHYATGNHEIRYEDYINRKAPAFKDFVTPEFLWKTDTYGIELSHYNNPPFELYPGFYVHHGPYALKDAGSSVRKVMDEFCITCMVGHSHRQAFVHKTFELAGFTLRGWELGHLTDTKSDGMAYDRLHDWCPGFAVGYYDDGYMHVELVTISPDFTCMVGGKLYKA